MAGKMETEKYEETWVVKWIPQAHVFREIMEPLEGRALLAEMVCWVLAHLLPASWLWRQANKQASHSFRHALPAMVE